jgi:uncharacterized YigZ family protein
VFKIDHITTFTQEIKKSRFRAIASPVKDAEEAKEFLKSYSDAGANHNCWAWRVGQTYRFSDDGEPSGTAGKPILQAIDGQMLDGIAVIVIRWFGGILLGSGGLVRAYGGTAAACLRAAEKSAFVATRPVTIGCVFGDLALVESRLALISNAHIHSRQFNGEGAELIVQLPEQEAAFIVQMIVEVTSGRATISVP